MVYDGPKYIGPRVCVSEFLKLWHRERLCKCCGSVTKFPFSDECYNPWCDLSREGKKRIADKAKKFVKKVYNASKMEVIV